MSSLIDSHCHLYYEPYINDIQGTIDECKKNNIYKLLSIGVDLTTSKKNIELAQKYNEIYCTVGIHPNSTANSKKEDLLELEQLIKSSNKIGLKLCVIKFIIFKFFCYTINNNPKMNQFTF